MPEAAALLSISQEYLYRLIQAGGFPAVRMSLRGNQGRYVVPAKAVEKLLDDASAAGSCVELGEWAQRWQADTVGGAA
ncbi:MAG: helix-turn-helix transcriptional regulator [Pseudonocardiaceae bacterium]